MIKETNMSKFYNVVASNSVTGEFYVCEDNLASKQAAYQLFDSLVAQGQYDHVRVDRSFVTVRKLPNGKLDVGVSDRWLDKHWNSKVTKVRENA
jgi:hypothetical protein